MRSLSYWDATVTPGGVPHARPVWGVGLELRFYFSSGSRIRIHVLAKSRVSIHLESGEECVIVDGVASELHEAAAGHLVTNASNSKWACPRR